MLAWASSAEALTPRYADDTPAGSMDCSSPANACDLQTAVEGTGGNPVSNGDEVIVLPGTYNEGSNELDIVNDINVHGQDGQPRPTINTSAFYGVFTTNVVTIRHLDIEHTGTLSALAVFTTSGSSTVADVVAHSNAGEACDVYSATIRDSVCWNSKPGNFGVGLGSFINAPPPVTTTLRNVTIEATGPMSYGIDDTVNGGASSTINAKSVIAHGSSYDVYASIAGGASSASVTLDHSNYTTILAVSGATITDPSTNMNQMTPPAFVDATNGDFHQLVSSTSTIDVGAVDGSSGTTDIDGDARSLGAAPDIGADEYVPSSGGGGGPPPPPPPDTTAPDTLLGKSPKPTIKSKKKKVKVSIEFSATESGSSECSLDDADFAPCSSPFTAKVKRGKHSFEVRAKDQAGNVDTSPAVYKWKVKKK